MSSAENTTYELFLITLSGRINTYFAYYAPWIGLVLSTFGLLALLSTRKPRHENLLLFIFAWQYSIGIIYSLNMIFLDRQTFVSVTEPVCKLTHMFTKFVYCLSPWMQVVSYLLY